MVPLHRVHWPELLTDPASQVVKNPSAKAGDTRGVSSIPRLGRSCGGGHSNPLQYTCLENPMNRAAWWATVCGAAQSWTQLEQLSTRSLTLPNGKEAGQSSFSGMSVDTAAPAAPAAAAESLQSCPTLCDPIDGSPPVTYRLQVMLTQWTVHDKRTEARVWRWGCCDWHFPTCFSFSPREGPYCQFSVANM